MEIIKAGQNDGGQRLDKLLSKRYKAMPTALMYKYIRTKRIKVNGKRAKENQIICIGDEITLYIPEEFTGGTQKPDGFTRLTPRLTVAYEDSNILIAHKKAGMLVHSDEGGEGDTLIDHIKAYLYQKGEYDPSLENSFAPALCNRIDRNTEGLVISAKNAAALRDMNEIIKLRKVKKTYLAVCHGFFQKKQDTITSYLEKNASENKVFVKKRAGGNAKTATLKYRVIAENKKEALSLLEIELLTGRTHQIRVQMAESGHPLLGDGKYAVNKDDRKKGYSFQALCSFSLTFTEPTGCLSYLKNKYIEANSPKFLALFQQ